MRTSVKYVLCASLATATPAAAQCVFGGADADGGTPGFESCTAPTLSEWSYGIETREPTYVESDCWRRCIRPYKTEDDAVEAVNCFSSCMRQKYPGTPENPPSCGDRLTPAPPLKWKPKLEAYGVHLESVTDLHFVCSGGYPLSFRRGRTPTCPGGFIPRGYVTPWNYPQRCVRPISACSNPRTQFGNPIEVVSGEKTVSFVDIPDTGSGLSFGFNYSNHGYYRSLGLGPADALTPGADFWNHTFASRMIPEVGSTNLFASVVSANGRVRHFGMDSKEVLNTGNCGTTLAPNGAGYLLRDPNGSLEEYGANFKLLARTTRDGKRVTLAYSTGATPTTVAPWPGLLVSATDAFGRTIVFTHDDKGRLATATDADGNVVSYAFDSFNNLSSVTVPEVGGLAQRQYMYEQSHVYQLNDGRHLLTGIVDENGRRFATYSYRMGGATTVHAGNVGYYGSINYGAYSGADISYVKVDNPGGTYSYYYTVKIGGIARVDRIYSSGGAGYPYGMAYFEYNAQGDRISETDNRGYKTCKTLDSGDRHLEITSISGLTPGTTCASLALSSPPASARVVNTQWHPVWNLRIREAAPLKRTTWVYHGQPDPLAGGTASCAPSGALLPDGTPIAVLCRQIEEATTDATGALGFAASLDSSVPARAERWTYDAMGHVLTHDGPRTDVNDVTTSVYYVDSTATHTAGDLWKTTDALGNVTTNTKYTKSGELLEQVDPNGVVTTMTYDARHRLTSRTVAGLTTSFTYDKAGMLRRETRPDGTFVEHEYDDAHQLKATVDSFGTRVELTRNAWGHVTSERTKDAQGVLRREVLREYDTVGNLVRTTGEVLR